MVILSFFIKGKDKKDDTKSKESTVIGEVAPEIKEEEKPKESLEVNNKNEVEENKNTTEEVKPRATFEEDLATSSNIDVISQNANSRKKSYKVKSAWESTYMEGKYDKSHIDIELGINSDKKLGTLYKNEKNYVEIKDSDGNITGYIGDKWDEGFLSSARINFYDENKNKKGYIDIDKDNDKEKVYNVYADGYGRSYKITQKVDSKKKHKYSITVKEKEASINRIEVIFCIALIDSIQNY